MVIEYAPLEDELGDVLDKAMRHACCTEQALAERSGVSAEKIHDAIDYRYELTPDELKRLAVALGLNEPGLLALAQNRYPLPEISGLPFCLYPLRTPHGIGVANAYIVAECGQSSGILFDAGSDYAQIERVWPKRIRKIEAVFITHVETEHTGGLEDLQRILGRAPVFFPEGICISDTSAMAGEVGGGFAMGEGARLRYGAFEVRAIKTPGHAEAHNSYVVSAPALPDATQMLVSGDLIFAGSAGRGYFCAQSFADSLKRLFTELPGKTVIAPGHGPLTTLENERLHNPFSK
ncbi:hydroxyacylglutathione hydrolase [Ereboglobus sp. PH5-10]|uniref:MBL fold metallo-hydrolase n=1 Tax=Ereboglobus sp. PH5-10 TaxID=2940629 RepID=UPI002406CD38|nr:MBL fold metallo-hydrolase [Ereboglobus sp. PH5-10]MDF9826247.1 hydroxyacylglutathione hydrolase [Ereboglobus sp. PH5-10]